MKQLLLFCCLTLLCATAFRPGPKKFKLPKAYVYIPSGTYTADGKTVSVQGFFMQAYEVTNLNYREFLSDLQQQGRSADYEKARVRPEAWMSIVEYNAPSMSEIYHQHPAYENYPVVNITREGAEMYCEWLTGKLQARLPDTRIKVRLPDETEWAYAAQAGHTGFPYPHGYYLRNNKGEFLYNFQHFGDESIHRNPETGKAEIRSDAQMQAGAATAQFFGPAPAQSNVPNDFGLFNMSGNVAEMLAGAPRTKGGCFNSTGYDIRIDGPDEFAGVTEASPCIGFRPVVTVLGN